MQTIYLDISNKGVIPTIYAKQGDVGRKFEVVLTDSGLPYIPAGGSAFSVWYSGESGDGNYTGIDDKSAFSVNGNKVTVEMISQMLSSDGDGVLSLVLNDPNGNQISTWNIPYICEYVPGYDSEEAQSYYTAFSQAVQNLPYPDASLSVAGKAADAKATGNALDGKAPAGYGLGEISPAESTDLNNATRAGFYKTISTTQNSPVTYGSVLVIPREGSTIDQILFSSDNNYGSVLRRKNYVGAWDEWEWVNPPMAPGVEYRTTERWNGKVVYTKLMDFGLSENGKAIEISGATSVIRHSGQAGGYTTPYINSTNDNPYTVFFTVGRSSAKMWCGSETTGLQSYLQIWYTKD